MDQTAVVSKFPCPLHGEHDAEGHYECIGAVQGWDPKLTTAFLMARYENVVKALDREREKEGGSGRHSGDYHMHKGYLSALRTVLKRSLGKNELEAFLEIHRGRD